MRRWSASEQCARGVVLLALLRRRGVVLPLLVLALLLLLLLLFFFLGCATGCGGGAAGCGGGAAGVGPSVSVTLSRSYLSPVPFGPTSAITAIWSLDAIKPLKPDFLVAAVQVPPA